jgi:hypothetical protein
MELTGLLGLSHPLVDGRQEAMNVPDELQLWGQGTSLLLLNLGRACLKHWLVPDCSTRIEVATPLHSWKRRMLPLESASACSDSVLQFRKASFS